MSGYKSFAQYYDSLTKNVDYSFRAKMLNKLIKEYNKNARLVLDLACGTGSLTLEFIKLGYDMIGADASADMLSIAAGKIASKALLLNQDMISLDLYGTVDAVICILDSVNHLESESAVIKAFENAALFLNGGGVFIFDVNTEYKHREILGNNAFVYDVPDVFCVWQNTLIKENSRVNINLDFFAHYKDRLYIRESESFSEYFYSDDFLKSAISNAGLNYIQTLDGDSFDVLSKESQRLLYIAKKRED